MGVGGANDESGCGGSGRLWNPDQSYADRPYANTKRHSDSHHLGNSHRDVDRNNFCDSHYHTFADRDHITDRHHIADGDPIAIIDCNSITNRDHFADGDRNPFGYCHGDADTSNTDGISSAGDNTDLDFLYWRYFLSQLDSYPRRFPYGEIR